MYAKSGVAKQLLSMKRRTEIQLREGVLEESISTNRSQNIEALLGYSRGDIAEKACEQCLALIKPFSCCVIVKGFFQNACSSCHYNSLGKGCSFRVGDGMYRIS